jgi:hypothetical protein
VTRTSGRLALAALALTLVLGLASCGGDDEPASTTAAQPPPTAEAERPDTQETEPEQDETEQERAETEGEQEREPTETEPPESPEDRPGGAGDEEPARSLALFTGRDGRITPRRVQVPAFISIRVELRAEDEGDYGLSFDGNTLRVSGGLSSVATTLDGLRPGEAVVATPTGAGNAVRIEATAEPGP